MLCVPSHSANISNLCTASTFMRAILTQFLKSASIFPKAESETNRTEVTYLKSKPCHPCSNNRRD